MMTEESVWLQGHRVEKIPKTGLESETIFGNLEWRHILLSSILRKEELTDRKRQKKEWKWFGVPPVVYPYLFAAPSGYGKHTLEDAFASTACGSSEDESKLYRLFEVPETDLLGEDAKETCDNLRSFFDELERYLFVLEDAVITDENGNKSPAYFCFVKFGSLDTIFGKKKTALCFADCLKRLKQKKGRGFFILTACCDDIDNIHPSLKKEATVLSVSLPTKIDRQDMLSAFFQKHPFLYTDSGADSKNLCDLTDGMSFGQLSDLLRMMLLLYKGKCMDQQSTEEETVLRIPDPDVVLSGEEVKVLIDSIRSGTVKPKILVPTERFYETAGRYYLSGEQDIVSDTNQQVSVSGNHSDPSDPDKVVIDSTLLDDDDLITDE